VIVIAVTAAVVLPLALVLAEAVGFAPLARLAPLLHPKDQANLPVVRGIIDARLLPIVLGLGVLFGALVAALRALRAGAVAGLFTAVTVLATALWALVFGLFQPALARQRTLGPFMIDAAARTGGAPLYFYPGTFDFGAAFYAPAGTRHWRSGKKRGPGPHYVLVWDDLVAALPAEGGVAPEKLAVSAGTEPKGRRHLVLVRLP
jgi:hypothetical protein